MEHSHDNTASKRPFLLEAGIVKTSGMKKPIEITKYCSIAESQRTKEEWNISAIFILI